MLPSHDPLPFIRLSSPKIRLSKQEHLGTESVKSAVDVSSCTVQTNYSYSFWRHYSSEYEYTIWTTIQNRSEYESNIRYIPSLHTHSPYKRTSTLNKRMCIGCKVNPLFLDHKSYNTEQHWEHGNDIDTSFIAVGHSRHGEKILTGDTKSEAVGNSEAKNRDMRDEAMDWEADTKDVLEHLLHDDV